MSSYSPRLILVLALMGSTAVAASEPASAADRCEGTLCDLYYEHTVSPQPATPAQATPTARAPANNPNDSLLGRLFSGGTTQPTSPAGAAAAPRKPVAVQGGGVIGMMNGTAPTRCTGTVCDLFYGGPPPEEPAVAPTDAAVAAEPASEEAAVPSRRDRPDAPSEEETRPDCVADARDPWRCYRR